MRFKLSPELQEDMRRTQQHRDEIVRKAAYAPARVHPVEAAERELVRQEAERSAGSGEAVASAHGDAGEEAKSLAADLRAVLGLS